MKKSLLALAAMTAFTGVAYAQSSVTLFGGIDLNVRSQKNGDAGTRKSLSQDGTYSSRIGFRGVEDLGGGLRAGFWIEGAMNPDTGTPGGQTWQRRTTISLLGIIRHMAEVERHWWRHRVAGEDVPNLYLDDAEWVPLDGATAPADYAQLVDEWTLVDAVAARYELGDTFGRRDETWSIRTLYLHLIEEWARHNGHADLIREAIDGAVGE